MRTRLLGLMTGAAALAFAASAAQAADLPVRTAPPPVMAAVPIFSWTGFYVGAQVGFGWSDNDNNFFTSGERFVVDGVEYRIDTTEGFDDDDDGGFLIGAHVGYNVQFGSFVAGLEADLEWADVGNGDDTVTVTRLTGPGAPVSSTVSFGAVDAEFLGSIRGRLGFALDRTLIYATGGLAFVSIDTDNGALFDSPFFDAGDDDDMAWGWTIGAGVEYAFTNNLTARIEYRYTTFDHDSGGFIGTAADDDDDDDVDFHTVRLGVSFKF